MTASSISATLTIAGGNLMKIAGHIYGDATIVEPDRGSEWTVGFHRHRQGDDVDPAGQQCSR